MGKSRRNTNKQPRYKTLGGADVKPTKLGRRIVATLNGEVLMRNGEPVGYKNLPNVS